MNNMPPAKRKLAMFLTALALVGSFALGFMGATILDIRSMVFNDDGEVEIARVIDLYAKTRTEEVSFEQFWNVWNMIKQNYVDQPVSEVDLFYGAIEGMVQGLNDPYSVYFPPVDAKEFADNLSGEFEGIGAEIGIRDEQLTIIAPLPASPAEQAGLRAGDKVYAIDGNDTRGITVEKAVSDIRGERGTDVVLTVSHDGFEGIEDITITRDRITIPTIVVEEERGDIRYLRISHFNEDTWGAFNKEVEKLIQDNPAGLVLDLRSNPGGFLDSAVRVASEWVEDGLIVDEHFSDGRTQPYSTRGSHRLADIPTVVLVDQGTASGSEIVAGALQDHGISQIIGMQTFGKGSVQNFEILPDGSALKITVAKWLTPDGRSINDEGITPDILLPEMIVEDDTAEDGFRDIGRAVAVSVLLGEDYAELIPESQEDNS